MANRSYLYSKNAIPDSTTDQKGLIMSLSEFKSWIPLSQKLLVSGNPRLCQSNIFERGEEKVALVGDYDKGLANLKTFLDIFQKQDISQRDRFEKCYQASFEFLTSQTNKQKFIVLEPSEVLDMTASDLSQEMDYLCREIKDFNAQLTGLKDWSTLIEIAENARTNWEEELGIDTEDWSNVFSPAFIVASEPKSISSSA